MTEKRQRWSKWGKLRALAFTICLLLLPLAGCDTPSAGSVSTAGTAGISGSSGAAGSSGAPRGATVSFPSTTSILVRFPNGGGGGTNGSGSTGSGGGGASGGSPGSAVAQCVPEQPSGTDTGSCGDGFRSSSEACDDGNTLADDGCSPTCEITPQLVSPRVHALGEVTRINAGDYGIGSFGMDRFYTNGGYYVSDKAVSTSGVENAAPADVYRSERVGDFVYAFNGLSPGAAYTLRLHFAEIWFDNDSEGARVFNVAINGAAVLENFDIVSAAGGANKAVVREFSPVADVTGQIAVSFSSVVNNAKVSALELIPPANQAPVLLAPVLQINSGGDAVGSFGDDQFSGGGWTYSSANPITTSGVANAAPAEVYQSERWGLNYYTLPGLTPGELYTVRLHFAEIYYSSAGSRVFHVAINGKPVLEYFDIFSEVGANKALVRDFSGIATEDGQIVVEFWSAIDNPKLSALEILKPAQQRSPTLPARSIGAGRHPLAAGCNATAVAFSERTDDSAALYLSTFKPAGQPLNTVQVARGSVSTPDPGVAALPDDDFVVAWTDFDDDELGISLRKVVSGVAQGKAVVANEDSAFSQSASDIVFDGEKLVVAWADSHDPVNGPDLRYRLFTPDLKPITGDQVLAATGAVEDNVVLAGRNGHWAAAWRAGSQGKETIEVHSGESHWTVGPFMPGATGDRPDLVFLDDMHLAVAFTMGTDPGATGTANVSRLHAAILDVATPGTVASFAIPPARDPYAGSPGIDQSEPSLLVFPDHLLLSWRSGAALGDAKGSELWSRRIPFTVAPDHSVSVDPSHLEVPIVRTDAQRVGDQASFRVLGTNLWPNGGLVAAWDDQGKSFHPAGAPDVAVEFMPEPPELPPAVTTYPLSPNGKYYVVNVMKRNYPPPTVNATYANDARIWAGQFPPEGIFDGHRFGFSWTSPVVDDADAAVVLTVDLGRYFSLGAIQPWSIDMAYTANTTQIRVASETSHWTTVAPVGPTSGAFTMYEVDPPVRARFVEITQVGMVGKPRIFLSELLVFPSSQESPPPTSADGYDLGYLARTTTSPNMVTPSTEVPLVWPAGNAGRIGATGDGIVDIDFGAQYPVTNLKTCFVNPFNWSWGGRLDIAAIPGMFQTLLDTGLGQPFGLVNVCQDFFLPGQPTRYVRATNYYMPGSGMSPHAMEALMAFVTPQPRTTYFPLSADTKYFKVNVARRATGDVQPTASLVFANGAGPYAQNPSFQLPANVIDGDDRSFNWSASAGTLSTATATVTVDLGQVRSLGAIREMYGNAPALRSSLRVAQSLAGPWTTVLDDAPITINDFTTSFDAVSARYIELTMKGTSSVAAVNLVELVVYPSSFSDPGPSSADRLDLTYLPGISLSVNENMARTSDARIHALVQWYGTPYIKTAAQGGTGDGTVTYDLGQLYSVSEIGFLFYSNNWPAGGKVEVDDGTGNWVTVYDSGRGAAFGIGDGTQRIPFATRIARYVRVTGYFPPAANSGVLENIEVF
jgi:cysteine-rich repeat protein